MIKTWLTPYYSFNNLSIYDFGEETEAVIKPNPIMQRSYFLIHFIVSGEGTYTIHSASGERTVPLHAGDIFAIYPYDFIQYRSNPKNPMHYFWVNFNGSEGENILEYLGFSHENLVFNHNNPNNVYEMFKELFKSNKQNDKYLLMLHFLSLMNTIRKGNLSISQPKSQPRDSLFIRAELYIQRHITDNIKASDVANFLHVDRSYFSTIFKKEYKISPYAYIQQQKIEFAKTLLRTSNYSIRELADLLNFSDIYAFSSFFKKHCGVPPSQYKKNAHLKD